GGPRVRGPPGPGPTACGAGPGQGDPALLPARVPGGGERPGPGLRGDVRAGRPVAGEALVRHSDADGEPTETATGSCSASGSDSAGWLGTAPAAGAWLPRPPRTMDPHFPRLLRIWNMAMNRSKVRICR